MPELPPEITSWLDVTTLTVIEVAPALFTATATVAGASAYIVASDPIISRGALGVEETEAFLRAVQHAKAEGLPLILYIDSAGAKVSEGVVVQGALRKLVRELLDARSSGLRIFSVLGRNVFGGASFLGFSADARVYSSETRLAMTGPGVLIENNEASKEEIDDIVQSISRVKLSASDFSLLDYTPQHLLKQERLALNDERELLKRRLVTHKLSATPGRVSREGDRCVRCEGEGNVSAADALLHAETLDACAGPIELYMTWQAHSLSAADEAVLLSQYLMHLAKTMHRLVAAGTSITLHIEGHIAGGFYLAVAGPATRVVLHPNGSVRTLPKAALVTILKSEAGLPEEEIDPVAYGLVDACID
ncbi:MAG: hypothetical protein DHS20C12_27930 [Pseudohongiella sp.]|nr:MAG: hypothetical protein DHS20C12_27930 [Pseudohongiella sp.]